MNTPGKVTKEEDGYKVQFERLLNHPIEKVWASITDPEFLRIWFAEMEIEFIPGGKIIIYFLDEERTISYGQIVRIEPPSLFEWTWETELARWELERLGPEQTLLRLTYSGVNDEYAPHVPAGWHILLDQLETVLNGRTEPYPFGTGKTSLAEEAIKQEYQKEIYAAFPHLKK